MLLRERKIKMGHKPHIVGDCYVKQSSNLSNCKPCQYQYLKIDQKLNKAKKDYT